MTFDFAPGNVQLVSVGSVLTLDDARALGPVLVESLPPDAGDVVLDLSSTSLAARPAIVVALRELRRIVRLRGRRAIVVAPDDHRRDVLSAARFDSVMLLAPSLESAMQLAGRTVYAA